MKIVIDTNVLVSSLSRHSVYHWLITHLLQEKLDVCLSTEILLEYEEISKQKYSVTVATNFLASLKELTNVHFIQIYYRWQLLKDVDDDKFIDYYIAANAEYLITNDKGFKIVQSIPFPKINIISIQEFEGIIASL